MTLNCASSPQKRRTGLTETVLAATLVAGLPFLATAENAQTGATAMTDPSHIVQFVKFESALPRDEVLDAAAERKPLFEAMPGLVQKYYLELDEPNTYGGIYIWKDKASMAAFLQTDLFKGIPAAYGIKSKPQVDIIPVLYPLR